MDELPAGTRASMDGQVPADQTFGQWIKRQSAARQDQVLMIDLAMARLAKGGVLYFSNNFRKFELDEGLQQRYAIEEISAQTLDPDFARNPKIHRAWRIVTR